MGANHGQNKDFWHQGWHPGLLYLWLVHFLSLWSLYALLFCCHLCLCALLPLLYLKQFTTQQIVKGRRQEEEALGGSCRLIPFIHFWKGDTGPRIAMVLIPHRAAAHELK